MLIHHDIIKATPCVRTRHLTLVRISINTRWAVNIKVNKVIRYLHRSLFLPANKKCKKDIATFLNYTILTWFLNSKFIYIYDKSEFTSQIFFLVGILSLLLQFVLLGIQIFLGGFKFKSCNSLFFLAKYQNSVFTSWNSDFFPQNSELTSQNWDINSQKRSQKV